MRVQGQDRGPWRQEPREVWTGAFGVEGRESLKGYRVGELENHISLLHEYNDVKDVAQMLLGKLGALLTVQHS
ncbi:hypothetical protein A6R68_02201 [Neotoma lepida]|uniref:DNA repair protein SWI5 homolog n=1 Tax=Neotoma lepida TaxID=56216 RepID=A0A1A6GSZ3_NEOLE|nr:hypothetical protein A6R68_02201 [Neotoma lepida]